MKQQTIRFFNDLKNRGFATGHASNCCPIFFSLAFISHFCYLKSMQRMQILEQMEGLLDQLLQTAETMQALSRQVVSENELVSLQQKQSELVAQLTALDASFHKIHAKKSEPDLSGLQKRIREKLKLFQDVNVGFIDNLKTGQKIIEVEASLSKKIKNHSSS